MTFAATARLIRRGALVLVVAAACARPGWRVAPYQGEMVNLHARGEEPLARAAERNPAVASWVAQHGRPEFIVVTGPDDVELVYYSQSRLVHFHGGDAGELSPLPLEVVNVLPLDLRAGTPGRIDPEVPPSTGCWHVVLTHDTCRTCCRSALACSTACKPRAPAS